MYFWSGIGVKRKQVCLAHAICSIGKRTLIRRKEKGFCEEGETTDVHGNHDVRFQSVNTLNHLSSTLWCQLDHKCNLRSHVALLSYEVVTHMR